MNKYWDICFLEDQILLTSSNYNDIIYEVKKISKAMLCHAVQNYIVLLNDLNDQQGGIGH